MRLLAIVIASMLAVGCSTVPTSVTTKPDVTPVKESNRQIRESSAKIKASGEKSLKYNQDIQSDLNSAETALNKLLNQ